MRLTQRDTQRHRGTYREAQWNTETHRDTQNRVIKRIIQTHRDRNREKKLSPFDSQTKYSQIKSIFTCFY